VWVNDPNHQLLHNYQNRNRHNFPTISSDFFYWVMSCMPAMSWCGGIIPSVILQQTVGCKVERGRGGRYMSTLVQREGTRSINECFINKSNNSHAQQELLFDNWELIGFEFLCMHALFPPRDVQSLVHRSLTSSSASQWLFRLHWSNLPSPSLTRRWRRDSR